VLQTTMSVIADIIEIPRELIGTQEEVELCIDTLFINDLPFLANGNKIQKYQITSMFFCSSSESSRVPCSTIKNYSPICKSQIHNNMHIW